MDFTTDGGITAVVIGVLTVIGIILKRIGYLNLGKHNRDYTPPQEGCPDPVCHDKVVSTHTTVEKIRTDIEVVHSRINKVDNRVSNLQGYLEGKLGK